MGVQTFLRWFFLLIQEIFRVIFTANVSFKWGISQNTILMKKKKHEKFYYLFIYLFIQETIPDLLIIVFFCRSNEQLKGKLRHECSTEVTTEECILYFLHHKNGRLALESTRKPKVCPDKCHLGRTSSNFHHEHSIVPTYCPWVSEDEASWKRLDLSFS